jgi:predicted amidohydrolase YtcJ
VRPPGEQGGGRRDVTAGAGGRTLLRRVRLVPVGGRPAPDGEVDLRLAGGVVTEVAPALVPSPDEQVLDAEGRWAVPGLWDAHVHLGQWALSRRRLDLSGTRSPEEALHRLGAELDRRAAVGDRHRLVVAAGHRLAAWPRVPTVAELDAVVGERPVVLVSGDVHNGWCSSAALALLEVPPSATAPGAGPLEEDDWFPVMARLGPLERREQAGGALTAYRETVGAAAARGVVGVGDMEWEDGWREWPGRVAAGVTSLRVRTAVYRDRLGAVIDAGLRSGDVLDEAGLVTMGPLKVISDGSLGTGTAWCHDPYPASAPAADPRSQRSSAADRLVGATSARADVSDRQGRSRAERGRGRGRQNVPVAELTDLLARATSCGLGVAVHAIGDAAVADALDAVAATGAAGSVEHAQLVDLADLDRMARLGVVASVQPAHLVDDRELTDDLWADRAGRAYAFRSMLDAGVRLALGSDAPVAPLDPWLAMAAAVHRTGDAGPPWHQDQAVTVADALAASTDGRRTLAPGDRADVVLLDADPLGRDLPPVPDRSRALASRLRDMRVSATFLAGRPTHGSL